MITIAQGLKNSLLVLELLRNDEELKDIDVYIQCFMNCRECGLTFTVADKSYKTKTFCVYEHRNSDEIIVNSKEKWTSFAGDLPYKGDTKYEYDKAFSYQEYYKCYLYLKEEVIKYTKGDIK